LPATKAIEEASAQMADFSAADFVHHARKVSPEHEKCTVKKLPEIK
jgi:hypothetical protein